MLFLNSSHNYIVYIDIGYIYKFSSFFVLVICYVDGVLGKRIHKNSIVFIYRVHVAEQEVRKLKGKALHFSVMELGLTPRKCPVLGLVCVVFSCI